MNLEAQLEELRTQLAQTTDDGRSQIEPLLEALAVSILVNRNIRDAASSERLQADLNAVADAAAAVVLAAFVQSGTVQAALLDAEFDELLGAAGAVVAAEHRAIVLERTALVLDERVRLVNGQRDLSYLPGYAQTITDVAVGVGSKEGTDQTALLLGAALAASGRLKKMFVRVASRKEKRSHSSLEGSVIGANETWVLAGIPVQGPNDPALPLSERIYCGHAALFFIS